MMMIVLYETLYRKINKRRQNFLEKAHDDASYNLFRLEWQQKYAIAPNYEWSIYEKV